MTDQAKEQFIADAVRAMAVVLLTRRGDLTVVDTKKESVSTNAGPFARTESILDLWGRPG
jgi:hypothetical protein